MDRIAKLTDAIKVARRILDERPPRLVPEELRCVGLALVTEDMTADLQGFLADIADDVMVDDELNGVLILVRRLLPGWSWRMASCCVSDDAWLMPDYNDPEHRTRLLRQFDPLYWNEHFVDVDSRPAGRPAMAMLLALLMTLKRIERRGEAHAPDPQ